MPKTSEADIHNLPCECCQTIYDVSGFDEFHPCTTWNPMDPGPLMLDF